MKNNENDAMQQSYGIKKVVKESNEKSVIDGMSLQQARKFLQKNVIPLTLGLYKDEHWAGPKKIWDYLNKSNINWSLDSSKYGKDRDNPMGENKYKQWNFSIEFVDDKGKERKIGGVLTAHGAGTVAYPLEKYDMTCSIY